LRIVLSVALPGNGHYRLHQDVPVYVNVAVGRHLSSDAKRLIYQALVHFDFAFLSLTPSPSPLASTKTTPAFSNAAFMAAVA
jgi:hypothetical protein